MSSSNEMIEINKGDGKGWKPIDETTMSPKPSTKVPNNTPSGVSTIEQSGQNNLNNAGSVDDIEAVQVRLGELAVQSNLRDELPRSIYRRLLALRHLEDEREVLQSQYKAELAQLELKYQEMYQPLYSKRADIVTGRVEPESTAEDEAAIDQVISDNTEGEPQASISEEEINGIPEFWATAITNHDVLAHIVTDKDIDALHYLTDIRSYQEPDPQEQREYLRLEFDFAPNPYFSNTCLSKVYESTKEPETEKATGSTIEWKENMNLCEKVIRKKQRVKGTSRTRIVTSVEPSPSFFHLFGSLDSQSISDDDVEEQERASHQLETDFQLGYIFHEQIIPEAVLWFTGEAESGLDDEDEDYIPGDDDEDDDESDSEAETGSSDEDHPAVENASSTDKPPECKNQ